MTNPQDLIRSTIDPDAPIDFEALQKSIKDFGPLRLSSSGNPYIVDINIEPCMCALEGCDAQLVSVWRRNGIFTMHWMLSKEDLLSYESLTIFKNFAILGGIKDSRGERMIVELQSRQMFGVHFSEVEPIACVCESCVKALGENETWNRMLLSQLSTALQDRNYYLAYAKENFGEVGEDIVKEAFDLGYFAGRAFSELAVKKFIEPDAIAGRPYEEIKQKRAAASGQKSAKSRASRIKSLLIQMEKLAQNNPAFIRLGATHLAALAVEDASSEDPALWSQGKGQLEEYLGELRRGEAGSKLQERYLKLFPTKSA